MRRLSVDLKPRLVFADQLGPEFIDDYEQPRVIIQSRASFFRPIHYAKAQLMLSAIRHAAAESVVPTRLIVADDFAKGVAEIKGEFEVINPTSYRARALIQVTRTQRCCPVVALSPAKRSSIHGFLRENRNASLWRISIATRASRTGF
jgi:hypothetical protein